MRSALWSAWRHLRSDTRRYLICFATIAIGVAFFVGAITSMTSARQSLASAASSVKGLGQVSVVTSKTGELLDQCDVDKLLNLPDVE